MIMNLLCRQVTVVVHRGHPRKFHAAELASRAFPDPSPHAFPTAWSSSLLSPFCQTPCTLCSRNARWFCHWHLRSSADCYHVPPQSLSMMWAASKLGGSQKRLLISFSCTFPTCEMGMRSVPSHRWLWRRSSYAYTLSTQPGTSWAPTAFPLRPASLWEFVSPRLCPCCSSCLQGPPPLSGRTNFCPFLRSPLRYQLFSKASPCPFTSSERFGPSVFCPPSEP